jgi:eukaryotic-like serine/threonine-protein kinase
MASLPDGAVDRLRALLEERYEIQEEIGRGGMGVVYRAFDTLLQRDVALKAPRVSAPGKDGAGGAMPTPQRLPEAQTLAQLEHPGIVAVHDAGRLADGRPFYVMRLVAGKPPGTDLPLAEALRIFVRICEPVAFAHARGIVHGDLKLANVIVGPFGEVLVVDWGLACIDGEVSARGGTVPYAAPEAERTPQSDVFSLGQMLAHMTTAPRPRPVESIVRHSTEADPRLRFSSVAELAAEVNRYLDGERVRCHHESIGERLARIALPYRTLIALLLAYLLMRVALLFWMGR